MDSNFIKLFRLAQLTIEYLLVRPRVYTCTYMYMLLHVVHQVVMLWLRCFGCSVLICMCDLAQPAELPQ